MECEHCKHNFSNKHILKNHQTTAVYCLKIQNKHTENVFKCTDCDKKFTSNYNANRHKDICKAKFSKYKVINVDLTNQIKT